MKADVRSLLQQVQTTGFQKGDLVLTAEIHRVIDPQWGYHHRTDLGDMAVSDIRFDGTQVMDIHIMGSGGEGQQRVMKLLPYRVPNKHQIIFTAEIDATTMDKVDLARALRRLAREVESPKSGVEIGVGFLRFADWPTCGKGTAGYFVGKRLIK
jgi:hypothetical protein